MDGTDDGSRDTPTLPGHEGTDPGEAGRETLGDNFGTQTLRERAAAARPRAAEGAMPAVSAVFTSRYRIVESIGQGQMGRVFKAEQIHLGRLVAIKFPLVQGADAKRRFVREGTLLSGVAHPNVVRLYDAALDEGTPYVVLEYVEGEGLRRLLAREGPLPLHRVAAIGCQLLDGLAAVHALSVIHRDVKTDNILVTAEGIAKLSDFGLARLCDTPPSNAGRPVGTPSYMSPEQAQGTEVGFPADLYSVGVVLFELLTGRPPFQASNFKEVLELQQTRVPPRARTLRPDAPAALDALLAASLSKKPAQRPVSAEAFGSRLRHAVGLGAQVRSLSISDVSFDRKQSQEPGRTRDGADSLPTRDERARPRPPRTVSFRNGAWLVALVLVTALGLVWVLSAR